LRGKGKLTSKAQEIQLEQLSRMNASAADDDFGSGRKEHDK
jgi:hypothetical protein